MQKNRIAGSDAVDLFMANYLMDEKLAHVRERHQRKKQSLRFGKPFVPYH
jgi:hypothetical protein